MFKEIKTMRSTKYFYIIFSISILIGCKKSSNENPIDNTLQITNIKNLPKEIDGCSCAFSENEEKYKNSEYLFVSNFDSIAFISVENKVIKLKLIDRKYKPNTTENEDYCCQYLGEGYKVSIEIKVDDSKEYIDESWWDKGKITIENKYNKKVVKNFVGESGC